MALNSLGRVIVVKKIAMVCSKCLKDQDKVTYFDSGNNHYYDGYLYCKPCWKEYYLMQPIEKRKEWRL